MLILLFSFLAGLVTILAPCIWPVLPIVFSVSITKSSRLKPLGISIGIVGSFTFFTLAISYLVNIFNFDSNILRVVAVIIIGVLGMAMILPNFSAILETLVSKLSSRFGINNINRIDNFWSGLLTGISLGILWTPCAGPILATIATFAATRHVSLIIFLMAFFYAIGIGIPIFLIAQLGQSFLTKVRFISRYTLRIQQVFGVIMVLSAIAIYTNYDQTLQLQLLNKFPVLSNLVNGFETSNIVQKQLTNLTGKNTSNLDKNILFNANATAPEIVGINDWINSKPLTLTELKGRVVLVDFWTYTCINCLRTLPFVTSWYEKYKNYGFVVIGVHTPEFQFEHDTKNVLGAVQNFGIHYPVAQDNDYKTWNAFSNQYWPAEYLIDAKGQIRREDFGEGQYDEMEMAIQELLKESGKNITSSLSNIPDQTPQNSISPETYFGSNRMEFYYPNGSISPGTQDFMINPNIPPNSFTLGGKWNIESENATTVDSSTLNYNFNADKVYIILRPPENGASTAQVLIDGNPVDSTNSGSDDKNGIITINRDRLYNIIDLKGRTENHVLLLKFSTPGTQVFTLTFG